MLGTADPLQDTAEPVSQAGGTSGTSGGTIFRNGQVLSSSVRGSVRNSPAGPRSEEGRDSLAACGIDHARAEPRAAACEGLTLEQEKV